MLTSQSEENITEGIKLKGASCFPPFDEMVYYMLKLISDIRTDIHS